MMCEDFYSFTPIRSSATHEAVGGDVALDDGSADAGGTTPQVGTAAPPTGGGPSWRTRTTGGKAPTPARARPREPACGTGMPSPPGNQVSGSPIVPFRPSWARSARRERDPGRSGVFARVVRWAWSRDRARRASGRASSGATSARRRPLRMWWIIGGVTPYRRARSASGTDVPPRGWRGRPRPRAWSAAPRRAPAPGGPG